VLLLLLLLLLPGGAEQERVVGAQLDPKFVSNWRSQFPALKDAGLT
jgi:hypothetical protein